MASVFYVRHQAAGVLWEFPFSEKPTDAQVAALARLCRSRHGEAHPKTEEQYWTQIVEMPVIGPGDDPLKGLAPAAQGASVGGAGAAEAPKISVDAVGYVKNP